MSKLKRPIIVGYYKKQPIYDKASNSEISLECTVNGDVHEVYYKGSIESIRSELLKEAKSKIKLSIKSVEKPSK